MIVIGIAFLVLLFILILISGKHSSKKDGTTKQNSSSLTEPVQKRGSNLYVKPMNEFNDVEFDRFAQTVEMRYRVKERYDM